MRRKQDSLKLKLIEQLQQIPIVQVACGRAGMSRPSYYRWRKEDEQFAAACDDALGDGVGLINDLAESKVIAGINESKPVYVLAWLNNHHPSYKHHRNQLQDAGLQEAKERYEKLVEDFEKKMRDFLDDRDDDDLIPYDPNEEP